MAHDDWLVGDRRSAAAERIYAAAAELIARDGIEGFDMAALQAEVHCSRATLYRHVGGKAQIRDAVLMREAERIVDAVRAAVTGLTGRDRTVTAVIVALQRIREDPLGQALLHSMRGVPDLQWIGRSETPLALASELTGLDDSVAAHWVVRIVLSLLVWPVKDAAVEHEMIQRFLAPCW